MRQFVVFFLALIGTFFIDQGIKDVFVDGYEQLGSCISLELHFNKGVAFGFLSFLGENLKWVQASFIVGIIGYLFVSGLIKQYALPLGMLIGAAIANLYDRFIHDGVVDYIYWHCGFDYPVFNYADIVVIISIAWIALKTMRESKV